MRPSPEREITQSSSSPSEILVTEPKVVPEDSPDAASLSSKGDEKGAKDRKGPSLGAYFRILSYGTRNGGIFAIILGLVCAMASGVALPLMNIVFGHIVGDFNSYFIPGTTVTQARFESSVNRNSLYIVYLFIGKFVLTYISMVCFRIVSLYASAALRLDYTKSLFSMPISKLDEVSVGTVTNAITAQSNVIQQSVSDRLAILFQSLALLIAAYAIAFRYSWALTLVVSSAILFVILCFSLTVPFLVKAQAHTDEADNTHASIAADTLNSIRTVFSLGAEGPLARKYAEWVDESCKRGLKTSVVSGIHLAALFFAMYVSFALAFWFGLKLYREGHIENVNIVITVFFSVLLVVTIMGGIVAPLMAISKAISASAAFFGVIDSERAPSAGLKSPEVTVEGDILFQDVSFAYPTRKDTLVLNGFNARFPRGQTTAIVGPSGSGKSTVVGLLERWYQVSRQDDANSPRGEIRLGNHNINDLDVRWWRSQIGLVQQEPFLFNDSIMNNVAHGLIGTPWEDSPEHEKMEMVTAACKEAFADEFIERLPEGYSTMVGEGGIALSGGQRQRVAIARSIASRPPILILDEATSSIDIRGERIVQAALDRVSEDRTTIMIAHRLSTVRRADNIVVMQDGRCVEEGTHFDLLLKRGVYHSLVNAQQLESLTEDRDSGSFEAEFIHDKEEVADLDQELAVEDEESQLKGKSPRAKSFFGSVSVILREHRRLWYLFSLIFFCAMGCGSGYALQSWLFARLIQVFQFTGQKLVDAANFWALMFFILALAMAAFYFTLGVSSNTVSMNIGATYRKQYFSSMLQQPVSYHDSDENSSGTLVSRLTLDPKQLQDMFGPMGIFPIISVFNIIGCVAISFSFGWKLAAVTFFGALPFILLGAFMRIRYEIHFESMNAAVYADSSKFATEAIQAFRTVASLTMEDTIIKRYSALLASQRRKAFRKSWYATLIFAFSDSVELGAMALCFWYGGQLLGSREYDPVAFFVVYIAIIQGGQAAGQFLSFGPNIAQAKASAGRIFSAVKSGENLNQPYAEKLPGDTDSSVELKDVAFRYSTRDAVVFNDLNVSIQSGQFVAFVGPSGCGKSTVISLLERFYNPVKGCILFGGRDIASLERSSYRSALALVSQEPQLFEGTVRNNLLLGVETANSSLTEVDVVQACKDAEIHDFISSLPEGYDTPIGFNAQTSFSGGQKQRLCIARALIRNPRLLLLDEATSSLDSQSEKLVQRAMERLASRKSMTIIAVAHRLATIQKADIIFVFGEGSAGQGAKILERGSHQELLRRQGPYWQMYQAQALNR